MVPNNNLQTVRRMLDAWEAQDLNALVATMTPDARYHNVPIQPVEGHEAIHKWCARFLLNIDSFRVEYLAEGEGPDNTVFNERIDYMDYSNGKKVAVRVAGVFRLRDGLISDWRDYFDMAEFNNQLK